MIKQNQESKTKHIFPNVQNLQVLQVCTDSFLFLFNKIVIFVAVSAPYRHLKIV